MTEVLQSPSLRKLDIVFGSLQEKTLLPTINNFFGLDLKPLRKYDVFDFEDADTLVELKSRRTPKAQFPTTIVGKNKLDYAEKSVKTVYFIFSFSDGLFYWKYDKSLIGDKVKFAKGGRYDRGRPEVKDYAFIPVDLLIPILVGNQGFPTTLPFI
jgi:hypothetical protein